MTVEERLADEAVREWLGEAAMRVPVVAMNSSVWMVSAGEERYVLKITGAAEMAGLRVATWLEDHGLTTGAPLRMAVRGDRLVALLRFVDGRELTTSDGDIVIVGETLGRTHSLLVGAPVPQGLERWPWAWVDPAVIGEPDLRAAAIEAIVVAERLAPTVTHGILHGDPARSVPLPWRRRRADRLGCGGPRPIPVRRRLGLFASACWRRTVDPHRSGRASLPTLPFSLPSGGLSRRGTSRIGSAAAISGGSAVTPTTTRD